MTEAQGDLTERVLGSRYRLLRRLGAGGMGDVYEAEHVQIGRRVAVKILHQKLANDAEMQRRFLNEARAGGTLEHPNIAQALDFGATDDGAPFIVMELLEGEDLARIVERDGPLPVARAVAIAGQLADALSAAHREGIVHRDIKPENVFITAGDHVKLLDFGISKFTTAARATLTGAFIGSPQFMAPEQVADASRTDARTDIYSFGAVLYMILSGRPVFLHTSLPLLVIAIGNDAPDGLAEVARGVPAALAELVERMLAKSPDDRPQTMDDVRSALAALRADGASPGSVPEAAVVRVDTSLGPKVDALATTVASGASGDVVESRVVLPTRTIAPKAVWLVGAVVAIGLGAAAFALARSEPSVGTGAAGSAEETRDTPASRAPSAPTPTPSPASVEGAANSSAQTNARSDESANGVARDGSDRAPGAANAASTAETTTNARATRGRPDPAAAGEASRRAVTARAEAEARPEGSEARATMRTRAGNQTAADTPDMATRIHGVPIEDTY